MCRQTKLQSRRCKTFQIYKMQSAIFKCTFYEHLWMRLQEIRGILWLETYVFFPALFWIVSLFPRAFQSVKIPLQGSVHHTKRYPQPRMSSFKIFSTAGWKSVFFSFFMQVYYRTALNLCLICEEWDGKVFVFWKHKTQIVFCMTTPAVWDGKSETVPNISTCAFFTVCQVWWMAWHPLGPALPAAAKLKQ